MLMIIIPRSSPSWKSPRRPRRATQFTLLDLCKSSLRRGHANLLWIVPILTDDPRRKSNMYVSICYYSLWSVIIVYKLCTINVYDVYYISCAFRAVVLGARGRPSVASSNHGSARWGVDVYIYIYIYIYMYLYLSISLYIYIYIYRARSVRGARKGRGARRSGVASSRRGVCIYIYIYIYTYTYIHT